MDRTLSFRRNLAARLIGASALALPTAATAWIACSPFGGTPGSTTECFAPFEITDSGATEFDGGASCPSMDQANANRGIGGPNTGCGRALSEPTFDAGACCYLTQNCGGGRPYLDGGQARTAPPRLAAGDEGAWLRGRGLAGASTLHPEPHVADLAPEVRARLAAAWVADGLLEHASIASFGRFALELLAVGAPADLVAGAHRAALDEVEHARLCLDLARAYGGEAVTPAPFPFGGRVEVGADLGAVAARAVREGCVGETLAAVQAAEQLARAEDPGVRAALAVLVEDEARHAELAFRFVAWAVAHGGADVRAAVARAFAAPVALPTSSGPLPREMVAHGRPDPSDLRAVLDRTLHEVIGPCAARMLAAAGPAPGVRAPAV